MSAPEGWEALCPAAKVPDGGIVPCQVGGKELAVARVGQELFCIDAVCSHALGYLDEGEIEGYEIECPLHEGRFDMRSGKPTREPAELPIGTYQLRDEEGMLYVRIDQ